MDFDHFLAGGRDTCYWISRKVTIQSKFCFKTKKSSCVKTQEAYHQRQYPVCSISCRWGMRSRVRGWGYPVLVLARGYPLPNPPPHPTAKTRTGYPHPAPLPGLDQDRVPHSHPPRDSIEGYPGPVLAGVPPSPPHGGTK